MNLCYHCFWCVSTKCNIAIWFRGNIDMAHIHWSVEYGLEYTSSVALPLILNYASKFRCTLYVISYVVKSIMKQSKNRCSPIYHSIISLFLPRNNQIQIMYQENMTSLYLPSSSIPHCNNRKATTEKERHHRYRTIVLLSIAIKVCSLYWTFQQTDRHVVPNKRLALRNNTPPPQRVGFNSSLSFNFIKSSMRADLLLSGALI